MRVIFSRQAEKDFLKLNSIIQKRIGQKLRFYADAPDPLNFAKPLANFASDGTYRFRIGDYRVIFDITDDMLAILHIDHRSEVYRKR